MKKAKVIVFDFDGMLFDSEEMFSDRLSREYQIPKKEIVPFFKNEFSDCQKGKKDIKNVLPKYLEKWRWKKDINNFFRILV